MVAFLTAWSMRKTSTAGSHYRGSYGALAGYKERKAELSAGAAFSGVAKIGNGVLTNNQDSAKIEPMAKKRLTLTGELKAAITTADMSMGQIARESGIDIATISRFVHGKGGLSMEGLDAIGECLRLRIVTDKPQKKGGK